MINKKSMMDCVYHQLAIDYNCSPDDFLKDGLIFTEARAVKAGYIPTWVHCYKTRLDGILKKEF
jgi:hypothetical protein